MAEWLEDLYTRLPEMAGHETAEECGPMACILHGDYWTNNFMFHYDDAGKPDSLKMVDYQIARLGHPLNELLFFFYTSTTTEMRSEHMICLFHIYFDTLKKDLELLDVDLEYSFEDFLQEYKKRSRRSFLLAGL